MTDTILKKKKFDSQTDSVIRDSYFKAKAENDILLPKALNDSNKASFVVERVYSDNKDGRATIEGNKTPNFNGRQKQNSFAEHELSANLGKAQDDRSSKKPNIQYI